LEEKSFNGKPKATASALANLDRSPHIVFAFGLPLNDRPLALAQISPPSFRADAARGLPIKRFVSLVGGVTPADDARRGNVGKLAKEG